mmetsp:Transcript_16094/g.19697  ORF Transcript_16094/g.19697 Transcript_16094/m.19697 type:complete len:176 (+) Transcript_16094:386-913(+)
MKILPRIESNDAQSDISEESDNDILTLHREWHQSGLEITAPIVQPTKRRPILRRGGTDMRLDGTSLLAFKMDEVSASVGLEGVSDSAVQLMSIALHIYARTAMRRCHAEFLSRQAPFPPAIGSSHVPAANDIPCGKTPSSSLPQGIGITLPPGTTATTKTMISSAFNGGTMTTTT